MLPTVTREELIRPFNFYFDSQIHQGMSHQGRLNFLVQTFSEDKRDKAYDLATKLTQKGVASTITVSSGVQPVYYRVWVDLSAAKSVKNSAQEIETVSNYVAC